MSSFNSWASNKLSAASTIWLAVILVLYLAPSKYYVADIMAAVLLTILLGALGLRRSDITGGIKLLAPLLVMLLYVILIYLSTEAGHDVVSFMRELLIGSLSFLLLYVFFRNQAPAQVSIMVVLLLVVPGLVHIGLMYTDILLEVKHSDTPFLSSYKPGLIEYAKDAPRVGRRYVSMALLPLLCGELLMAKHPRRASTRYLGLGISSISVCADSHKRSRCSSSLKTSPL